MVAGSNPARGTTTLAHLARRALIKAPTELDIAMFRQGARGEESPRGRSEIYVPTMIRYLSPEEARRILKELGEEVEGLAVGQGEDKVARRP